jgi:DNA polymerase gamma 1
VLFDFGQLKRPEEGFPLYCHEDKKWGYLVPKSGRMMHGMGISQSSTAGHVGIGPFEWTSLNDDQHTTHDYFKLPHPDGPTMNCGSPFSKAYLYHIQNGNLRSTLLSVCQFS